MCYLCQNRRIPSHLVKGTLFLERDSTRHDAFEFCQNKKQLLQKVGMESERREKESYHLCDGIP